MSCSIYAFPTLPLDHLPFNFDQKGFSVLLALLRPLPGSQPVDIIVGLLSPLEAVEEYSMIAGIYLTFLDILLPKGCRKAECLFTAMPSKSNRALAT